MTAFTENFLAIANLHNDFSGNEPAGVVREAIANRAERDRITRRTAVRQLSKTPEYGSCGEVGGVNVVYNDDYDKVFVSYTSLDTSAWMPLHELVAQAFDANPNAAPDWFEDEWIKRD